MRYRHLLVVSAAIAFALAGCNAQTSSPPAISPTVVAQNDLVRKSPHRCYLRSDGSSLAMKPRPGHHFVNVSVTDHEGRQVGGLKIDDFVVTEANSPLKVEFSEYLMSGPASIVIVADTSGSTQPKLPQIRETITQLIDNLDLHDDIAFYAVSGRPFLLQNFTTDHSLVIERESILHANGTTSLFDGVSLASKMSSRGCYARRAVIVISDGMDNASSKTADNTAKEARDRGVQIYAIGIGNNPALPAAKASLFSSGNVGEDVIDEESLGHLTKPTGGATFAVRQEGDRELLTAAAQSINEGLGGQYLLGFIAASLDNDISIAVKNHSDYVVNWQLMLPASEPQSNLPKPAVAKSS